MNSYYVLLLIDDLENDIRDSTVNSFFWSMNKNIVVEYQEMMQLMEVDFLLMIYEYHGDSPEDCYQQLIRDFKDLRDLLPVGADHMAGSELILYNFKAMPSKHTVIPRSELDDAVLFQDDSESYLDEMIACMAQMSVILKLLKPEHSKLIIPAMSYYATYIKNINSVHYSSRKESGKFGIYPISDFIDPVAIYTRGLLGHLLD